uniref:F-box domain-containing protein n=1 Tax=Mucochytrium quahogii TaxID=96639 RepID=A0A7S2WJB4_9STRA|mmetsp:Transcript_9865/g.16147  ORF Transcript_9865/g.16147 Transcript_9865/m.16147 type:complete len:619 (+) Transcript_9865:836-2692(+)
MMGIEEEGISFVDVTKPSAQARGGILDVPPSVLISKILIFLEARDLVNLGVVSRALKVACDDPKLWQRLLFLDFSAPRLKGVRADFQSVTDARQQDVYFLPLPIEVVPDNGRSRVHQRIYHHQSRLNDPHDGVVGITIGETGNVLFRRQSSPSSMTDEGLLEPRDRLTALHDDIMGTSLGAAFMGTSSQNLLTPSQGGNGSICAAKLAYLKKAQDFEERIMVAKVQHSISLEIEGLVKKREKIESYIRFFTFDFTTAMLALCPLVTLIFLSLQMDEKMAYKAWVIMSPIISLMCIIGVGIIAGAVLRSKQNKTDSILFGMYPNFRGFVQFWMHKILKENMLALCSGVVIYVCFFVFVMLIGIKLGQKSRMTWVQTFLPFWGIMIIFALSPLLKWGGADHDMESFKEPYIVLMGSIWIPITAFSIVLPLYLDDIIKAGIVIVLIPLWVVEAEFLVFPFVTLIQSLITRKDISDSLLVVFVMCVMFTPLAVFEVLLCFKVAGIGDPNMTYVNVFTPLFIWFALCALALINFLVQYERPPYAELSPAHPLILKKNNLGALGGFGPTVTTEGTTGTRRSLILPSRLRWSLERSDISQQPEHRRRGVRMASTNSSRIGLDFIV